MIPKSQIESIDREAWNAIVEWPRAAGYGTKLYGVDCSELTRFFLWDKVGRAYRAKYFPEHEELEERLYFSPKVHNLGPWEFEFTETRRTPTPLARIRNRLEKSLRLSEKYRSKRNLLIPYPHDRFSPVIVAAIDSAKIEPRISLAYSAQYSNIKVVPKTIQSRRASGRIVNELFEAMLSGLERFDIRLGQKDRALLGSQTMYVIQLLEIMRDLLERERPEAILVHTDNHPPYQIPVLLGNTLGIPTFMMQHGLDCERYYLDCAYASHIGTWGQGRLERYSQDSAIQPKRCEALGNPQWDDCRPRALAPGSGKKWLWVTRPHSPVKCYAPSRLPIEGLRIAEALYKALSQSEEGTHLVIKPHPQDYCEEYLKLAETMDVASLVSISSKSVGSLLPWSDLVISEDSTAGLEAIISGKPMVHAHLAQSKPTVPFDEFGAGLPGRTLEEIQDSVWRATQLTESEIGEMTENQNRFIVTFGGPLDGGAGRRFVNFMEEYI